MIVCVARPFFVERAFVDTMIAHWLLGSSQVEDLNLLNITQISFFFCDELPLKHY